MKLSINTNDLLKLIEQSENSATQKAKFVQLLQQSEPQNAINCLLIECEKSSFLLRGIKIEQLFFQRQILNTMAKVIIKTGSVEVKAHIKTPPAPTTQNRDILDTAAAIPSKDEIIQVINVAYTVFQAVQILWISIRSWFKKPTA